ncbi:hypothetical protein L0P88_04025 [Muricauda sp. SCSIO 64092]|uniref:hypothetical protein n=1 Tax=Allomuricauda sp. SCSIO 64092 TaxID=2908842 RepID=UPI001FF69261|nr:hypothetical protein [Muricauda sp. SCSIO 64092]UOY07722.1 hypothetical protein L0P88_04025 [Muricauda sp. SCSIO 64092]
MYTQPSLVSKGNGGSEDKQSEVIIINLADVANWPARNDNGVMMVGNITMKPGKYVTKMAMTSSKTSLPLASEGDEDNVSLNSLPEFSFPGWTLDAEELFQNFLNKSIAVGVRVGACGGDTPFYRIFGTPCAPLSLLPEGQNDNDATVLMVKFQQFAKTRNMPGRYTGTFTLATVNNVAADSTTVDVTAGEGEYQLTDNSVATVITDLVNATTGNRYTLLGSGGTNPATIQNANANFVLAGGVDWQALSGATITFEAIDAGSGDHVFVERSRSA